MHSNALLGVVLVAATTVLATSTRAHDVAAGQETVTPVLRQKLSDAPGKQIAMVVVSYAPGQASTPHVHSGSVFAYVLEGAVVSQLEGHPEVVYRAGESWYEPPRTPHLVSRNGSASQPAKLLAVLLADEGAPLKLPLDK